MENTTGQIEQRRRDIAARFPELKIDCLLIESPANVRYLSGYNGSNGLILLTSKETHFFTDPRYEIASKEIPGRVHVVRGPLVDAALKIVQRKRLKKIGFESSHTEYESYAKLKEGLRLGATLIPVGRIVEERRMIKSPDEIATIHKSVRLNSDAYLKALRRVRPGVREMDIAAEIEYQMKLLGAEKPSFDSIVAAGPRSALPHAHPTNYRLAGNEVLLIDMGAFLNGYASDMTRTIHLGRAPLKIRHMYSAVLEAQLAGIDAVRPGTTAGRVDLATRNILKKHGLDKQFVHSTGHGLGLEIHESPRLGKKDKTVLKPGMAITIEPGVYLEGFAGVRIEDTVLVTENGCEILTPTSKDFVQI